MRIVAVGKRHCVLDSGEELLVRYEKLHTLCEQLWQEQCDVIVRAWWTQIDGTLVPELIEIHRITSQPTVERKDSDGTLF